MRDYLEIGSSPNGEDCVQVDSKSDYLPEMKLELKRYKKFLEDKFPIPVNVLAYFGIKWNSHDFGSYGEVVVYFDDDDEIAQEFAFYVEGNSPELWTDNEIKLFVHEEVE